MFERRQFKYSPFLIFTLFLIFTSCGGSGTDDTPGPNPIPNLRDAPVAVQISLDDQLNSGNASDFSVKFIGASDESSIQEYRVILVKASEANAFTLEEALALSSDAYHAVSPKASIQEFKLSASLNDHNGLSVSNGESYRAFVVSITAIPDEFESSISSPSNSVTLKNIESSIKISYVGAMGIVISDGTDQVIADGLHSNIATGFLTWIRADQRDLDALAVGGTSWGPSDLLLTTHAHGDHFSPFLTNSFLRQHSNALYIAAPLARAGVSGAQVWDGSPDSMKSETLEHGNIKVTVLNTVHYQAPLTANYAFLIEIGGKRVLHLGDADLTAANLSIIDFLSQRVDVVILTGNQLNEQGRDFVRNLVNPRNVILSHFSPGAATQEAAAMFPGSIVFNESGMFVRY